MENNATVSEANHTETVHDKTENADAAKESDEAKSAQTGERDVKMQEEEDEVEESE